MANDSRQARSRLVEALRTELMGPRSPDEAIAEFPTNRYAIGRLAPTRSNTCDRDSAIDPTENDNFAIADGEGEDGQEETSPPLIIGFSPSSFGLSFLIDPVCQNLNLKFTWGDYRREKNSGATIWKRYQRETLVQGIPVGKPGKLKKIYLSSTSENPQGVNVTGTMDGEIEIEGIIHEVSGHRAISVFVINRRTRGEVQDKEKDERWLFQPKMHITAEDGQAAFVAKDFLRLHGHETDDADVATNNLLYRHTREFATGHGVAAEWATPTGDGKRTTALSTEFIPSHEVPQLIAPSEQTGGANLNMLELSKAESPAEMVHSLSPMLNSYREWIRNLESASTKEEIAGDRILKEAAKTNIEGCKSCLERMQAGLDLIGTNPAVFQAFKFANHAMYDQRIHSLWAAGNRKTGTVEGSPKDFEEPGNYTWRPFQMGFILLNIGGVANEESDDRKVVDLLWFPTGGGKTEAYLGLAAFTLALRRLTGNRHEMHAGAGVSIIMRYTLRLLTLQQFQRATALICSCEVVRRSAPDLWGTEPFSIGVWVGRGTTPNTFTDSKKAIDELKEGKRPRSGNPVQLVSCPRCGTALVDEKGAPLNDTYVADQPRQRTLIWCCNNGCDFGSHKSNGKGLPVVVVDEEIYRTCPSLLLATVDKFARLPFKGESRSLFGFRNRYSPSLGHLTEAHGDSVEQKRIRDAQSAPRLLPPDLIIQDELHLISGPLGTMVGLYETCVDYGSSIRIDSGLILPKVIASTATIRRAQQQTKQLYDRPLAVFPPAGLSSNDSFFAKEVPIDSDSDKSSGRLYVGLNAPGSSTKTLLVRTYAALLAAGQIEIDSAPGAADPYGTLVGYFNSIRALGGAKRLVEDDIRVRLKYLAEQREFPRRFINNIEELTSRIDSLKIPSLLKRLENRFPKGTANWPIDTLLATNMISVGVDIDRLGLMVVTGQPKSTAEYIQATSRVGRKFPGLVVTMYNWMGARDLSHYERFKSYHSALYQYVEAISVTPFSSRAMDRGLRGIFAAMVRLTAHGMARDADAQNFDAQSEDVKQVIDAIYRRASSLVGKENAELVIGRLLKDKGEWEHLSDEALIYSYQGDGIPPDNARVLLKAAGSTDEGRWSTPGSLREVEPMAAFYLEDEGL